ncbi:uncharacterized protein ARMOST_00387 [Armillaria ostoyae]|uniref:Uncharacterized protein n=1 Tax=Armillaria ostoyae TaxID=47428 RepID=A0A284QKZ2_ARMOS|nr:uncharacterized protein ARMOST_00387 [Armillaria ostoyae]
MSRDAMNRTGPGCDLEVKDHDRSRLNVERLNVPVPRGSSFFVCISASISLIAIVLCRGDLVMDSPALMSIDIEERGRQLSTLRRPSSFWRPPALENA